MEQKIEVKTCPHTHKEVLMQYDKGNTDSIPDWLCLHNDTEEEDKEAVRVFREQQKK